MLGENVHENTHVVETTRWRECDQIAAYMFEHIAGVHRLQLCLWLWHLSRVAVARLALFDRFLAVWVNTRPCDVALKLFNHLLVARMACQLVPMGVL